MRVVTLNLNGIRAAHRKGFARWLQTTDADIVCLQEVRAQESDLTEEMKNPAALRGYFSFAQKPGYSGTAILCKQKPAAVHRVFGDATMDDEGRYIRLDFAKFSAVSLYVPSGSSGDARQQIKYAIMEKVYAWLQKEKNSGRDLLICADINIAHTKKDICNWRGNQKNSGFLPPERDWLTKVFAAGWTDVFRRLNDEDGQYTWWSNRGQAWQKNVGWRLDYQIAAPNIAKTATKVEIYKQQRFSDHAPLIVDYAGKR